MRGYPGRGWGWNSAALPEAHPEYTDMELDRLKNQAESMQRTLDAINERIKEINKSE
jgi:prefoldin subunit 5